MPTKPGSVRPTAQLVAARLVAKLVDLSDAPDDTAQIRRLKEMVRRDPYEFEKFLKSLERDMRLGKKGAVERVEGEAETAAVDVPPPEKEDDGKSLEICRAWLKQRGVQS